MLQELEVKRRERERKLELQQFESATSKVGLRLEELRRNIIGEMKRENSRTAISKGDDKILMYKSEIAREIQESEIETLRSRMV